MSYRSFVCKNRHVPCRLLLQFVFSFTLEKLEIIWIKLHLLRHKYECLAVQRLPRVRKGQNGTVLWNARPEIIDIRRRNTLHLIGVHEILMNKDFSMTQPGLSNWNPQHRATSKPPEASENQLQCSFAFKLVQTLGACTLLRHSSTNKSFLSFHFSA